MSELLGAQSTEPADAAQPRRVIGTLGGASIVAGNMLGIGIFLAPRVASLHVQSILLYLGLWALGGLVAFAGTVSYAELSTMMPNAGGDYVYVRRAFGRSASFACGWFLFLGVFAGSIATMAVPVWQYQLPALLGELVVIDFAGVWVDVGPVSLHGYDIGAVGIIILLTALNALGARLSAAAQVLLTLVPVAVLAVGGVWALFNMPYPGAQAVTATADVTFGGLSEAFLPIYFAYAGWNAVTYVAGEVRDPQKTLPRSLIGGTLGILGLYLLLAGAFAAVLGMGGLQSAFEAGTVTATALGGRPLQLVVTSLIAIAIVGSLNGTILGGARVGYAMAQDGILHRSLGNLGSRRGAPVRALWLQAVVAAILVVSGTFEELIALTSLAMMALGTLTVGALFVLRWREPKAERPFRATGYPVLPALYIIVSVAVISLSVWQALQPQAEGAEGFPAWFPLAGIMTFIGLIALHALWSRTRRAGGRE